MRVIILDIDGTLMDTNYLHVEAWAQAFATVGHHVPRAAIHRQIGKGSQLLIDNFVQDKAMGKRVDDLHGEFFRPYATSKLSLARRQGIAHHPLSTRTCVLARHQR